MMQIGAIKTPFSIYIRLFLRNLRNRDTFSQEIRFLSKNDSFLSKMPLEWVIGVDLLN